MSTRSGKRIHSSFHENTLKPDAESILRSERKTRSKRLEDNTEELIVTTVKPKRRTNYVSYPTDDELLVPEPCKDDNVKNGRILRKYALKENNLSLNSVNLEIVTEEKPLTRKSRRGKKPVEDVSGDMHETENIENIQNEFIEKSKSKKIKKKKERDIDYKEDVPEKKTKKKGKGRKSSSIIVENIGPGDGTFKNSTYDKSLSVDSFHSAAGSPKSMNPFENKLITSPDPDNINSEQDTGLEGNENLSFGKSCNLKWNLKKSLNNHDISLSKTLAKHEDYNIRDIQLDKDISEDANNFSCNRRSSRKTIVKDPKEKYDMILSNTLSTDNLVETNTSISFSAGSKKRKSTIKDTTFEKSNSSVVIPTKEYGNGDSVSSEICNTGAKKRKSNINDSTFDRSTNLIDTTFDKDANGKGNSTYDKSQNNILDTTFEKGGSNLADPQSKKKSSVKDDTFDKVDTTIEKEHNIILMPTSARKSLMAKRYSLKISSDTMTSDNITLENSANKRKSSVLEGPRDTVPELNCTLNKSVTLDQENKRQSLHENSKLSLDHHKHFDATFDKSISLTKPNENSRSSLMSSDAGEIVDKSISRISITSDDSSVNIINTTPVLIESSMDDSQVSKQDSPIKPQTPLKREGTFTKDSPEVLPPIETPSRTKSLPTAGCTPYHANRSSQKRSVLNVTRSIEKGQGSIEAPRTTKVMFCSPVDNPALAAQEKRKIIKSNLKGSNKSFVFEDRGSPRPLRKRSYTASAADEARAKRPRPAAAPPAHRPARARTSSASAKLFQPTTPTKPAGTPCAAGAGAEAEAEARPARARLPDFAALHRRNFARMESLDECQARRARRARQLLSPTGGVAVLDRSSPRGTSEPPKLKEAPKKTETPTKPVPAVDSLRPGFTRFGFKLNLEVNPFSIPAKSERAKSCQASGEGVLKQKDKPPTGALARQGTLPSLTGATSARREVAKQSVLREKSFTDRRIVSRSENRTIIKGVRTNRRFELQMKMRNLE